MKYKLNTGFITQKIGRNTTIFSGEESMFLTLNETASVVFRGLKLGWEEKKIVEKLTGKYKVSKTRVESDIRELIEELKRKKIIVYTKANGKIR